jgi:hypothetical protein
MRYAYTRWISVWRLVPTLVGLLCWADSNGAGAQTTDTSSNDVVSSAWQHHEVTFTYDKGSCSNLERRGQQILLYLGARKDAKVSVNGCWYRSKTIGPTMVAHADFYTLAPVAADSTGTVKARWEALQVTPQHPDFMRAKACELVEAMKDVITKNFSLRDIEYRTDCHPHFNRTDAFAVTGQVLQAASLTANSLAPSR